MSNPNETANPNEGAISGNLDNRTEDQMLADILRTSPIVAEATGEPLSNEQVDIPTPAQAQEVDDRPAQAVNEQVNDATPEQQPMDASPEGSATPEEEVYGLEDLDDFKVKVKVGEEEDSVSITELVESYQTRKHIANEGRELGNARKQLEAERQEKLGQLDGVAGAAAQLLDRAEKSAAEEYHSYTEEINEARENGDTFKLTELKDKQEQAQKKYWEARQEKEGLINYTANQRSAAEQYEWNQRLEHFNANIADAIPDWSPEVAQKNRDFAISKGIPSEIVDQMADVGVVKFVDDYRRSEESRAKGAVKREAAPIKNVPLRKANPERQQQVQNEEFTQYIMDGKGTEAENDAFLKGMVSRHFE